MGRYGIARGLNPIFFRRQILFEINFEPELPIERHCQIDILGHPEVLLSKAKMTGFILLWKETITERIL